MGALTILKFVGIGLLVLLVVGGAYMLRHELIEKGKAIVYAQDNAARVKAQDEQTARDALLITAQNSYINDLQNQGVQIKEKIRVVQGPCIKDGTDDPRLGDLSDWLRSRPPRDYGEANRGRPPQGGMPTPLAPARAR